MIDIGLGRSDRLNIAALGEALSIVSMFVRNTGGELRGRRSPRLCCQFPHSVT